MAAEHYKSSIDTAPDFVKVKKVSDAAEAGPFTTKAHGINAHAHEYATIDVKAEGGANPNVDVLFWSEESAAFVQENPAISKTGVGANTGYQFNIDVRGRTFLPVVSGGLAGGQSATISVTGYGLDHTL